MEVTFVLLAYQEQHDYLVSLGSLMCQTNRNWRAIVFHNGPNPELKEKIYATFPDARISYHETPENNGTDTINREIAYKSMVETEFTVSTSIQDYYLPRTVEYILKAAEEHDFIYWNSINHLWLENAMLDAYPERRKMDWGNFAIRTSLARQVKMLHGIGSEDGYFVEEVVKVPGVRRWKIPALLTIHN